MKVLSSNFFRNKKVVRDKLRGTFAGLCLKKWVFFALSNFVGFVWQGQAVPTFHFVLFYLKILNLP